MAPQVGRICGATLLAQFNMVVDLNQPAAIFSFCAKDVDAETFLPVEGCSIFSVFCDITS
jgi:hypothetical protein